MARWTETSADQNHMVTISQHIPVGGIVRIVLNNGTAIEGVFRRMNIENNAGLSNRQQIPLLNSVVL